MANIIGINNIHAAMEQQAATPMVATIGHGHAPAVGQIVARPATAEEMAHAEKAEATRAAFEEAAATRKAMRENGRLARRQAKEQRVAEEAARAEAREQKRRIISAAKSVGENKAAQAALAEIRQAEREEREVKLDNTGFAPRPAMRIPAIKLESFKYRVVPAEAFLSEELKILEKLARIKPSDTAVADMRAGVVKLLGLINGKLASGKALVVNTAMCPVETGFECLAADIAGVTYGARTNLLVKTDVSVYQYIRLNRKVLASAFPGGAETTIDKIAKALVDLVVKNSVELDGVAYQCWSASAGMQKLGKCWHGEASMMKRTAEARHANVPLAAIGHGVGTTGAEELKVQALMFTPSKAINIKTNRVLVINSITKHQLVKRALEVTEDGRAFFTKNKIVERTLFDGSLFLLNGMPSFQGRGFGKKFMAINVVELLNMCFPGWENAMVPDIDGNLCRLGDYDAICTADVWKGKALYKKYGEECAALDNLSEEYPTINLLRIVRLADSAEEKRRHTSRQLVQQFLNADNGIVDEATRRDIRWLKDMKSIAKVVAIEAGMDKPRSEQTAKERLMELVPEIWATKAFQHIAHEKWERRFSDACSGNFTTGGQYPYIMEDPVAFFDIVIGGKSPDDPTIGLLRAGEINSFDLSHGAEVAFVRYPANFLTAQVLVNNNQYADVYEDVGNILVINVHDETMTVQDADVDGDEGYESEEKWIIDAIKRMIAMFDGGERPIVVFDHSSSAKKALVNTEAEMAALVSESLWNSQKFNKVGEYSDLAASCLNLAGDAATRGDIRARNHWMTLASFAHVGTIMVIDAVKTGKLPQGLLAKLEGIASELGGKKPYNQKYNKHTYSRPYWDESWENKLMKQSNSPVDRMAHNVETSAGEWSLDCAGMVFDINTLLCANAMSYAPHGRIAPEFEQKLGLYNANAKDAIQPDEAGEYSAKELMLYFWQNASAIQYRMLNDADADAKDAAEQVRVMQKLCRDAMMTLYTERVEKCVNMSQWEREKSIVNWFVRDAFEMHINQDGTPKQKSGNKVGDNAETEWEEMHLKASYAKFVIEVFVEDILDNAETNLGVTDIWTPNEEAESVYAEDDLGF